MTKHSAELRVEKNTITKVFKKKSDKSYIKFVKELSVYLVAKKKKLTYIPKLISYDYKNRSITTRRIDGYDLGTIDEKDYEKREKFLPMIGDVLKRLKKDLSLYHNDVLYRNLLYEPKKNKIFIIDFENCSVVRTNFDKKDWIEYKLKKDKKYNKNNKKLKTKKKSKK